MAEFDSDDFMSDFQALIECESFSNDLSSLARSARLVSRIGTGMLGAAPQIIETDGHPHVLWRFGAGPRKVVLIGHHDTVWPIGTLADFPYSVKDGVVRGPGADDMKGGLLIAIYALAKVRSELGHLDGVSLLITADEELGSPGSRQIIEDEARGAKAALVFESGAADGAVKIARKGVAIYQLEVTGLASHAGVEPEKGINATIEVANQVVEIAGLHKPSAGTSVVPTVMTSGSTTNTVPAKAVVGIDSRAASADEQVRIDDALRALTPTVAGAKIELKGGINRAPLEEDMAMGLYARAQRLAGRLGHPPLRSVAVGGGSDGNFTAGVGTPTLDGLGTVGGGSHARTEHALQIWIPRRIELTAALVTEFLSES
ncbi:M20/M25/M40 family metallo-hydrolase [Brevibacterium sp. H602]|uniref:M20/M25/M40 family metallo-hydrolase n=1 Tax=Brevibacterium sp. H602 TaxID=3444316 RepID=UPI003EB8B0B8